MNILFRNFVGVNGEHHGWTTRPMYIYFTTIHTAHAHQNMKYETKKPTICAQCVNTQPVSRVRKWKLKCKLKSTVSVWSVVAVNLWTIWHVCQSLFVCVWMWCSCCICVWKTVVHTGVKLAEPQHSGGISRSVIWCGESKCSDIAVIPMWMRCNRNQYMKEHFSFDLYIGMEKFQTIFHWSMHKYQFR